MPDEDNNFDGSLVLDLRKQRCHLHTKNISLILFPDKFIIFANWLYFISLEQLVSEDSFSNFLQKVFEMTLFITIGVNVPVQDN